MQMFDVGDAMFTGQDSQGAGVNVLQAASDPGVCMRVFDIMMCLAKVNLCDVCVHVCMCWCVCLDEQTQDRVGLTDTVETEAL